MTDEEVLKVASEVGWNVEHKATNDYLVRFARALGPTPLTDEEIDMINRIGWFNIRDFARAIEKAHGIGEQHV